MARLPRLYAPGCPNWCKPISSSPGSAVATAPADILNQLATWLGESAQRHRVSVHAWLLANDRILLLATPADEEGLPRLMQTWAATSRRAAAAASSRAATAPRCSSPAPGSCPRRSGWKPIRCAAARRRIPIPGPGPRPAAIPATPTRRPRNGSRTTPITGPAAIRAVRPPGQLPQAPAGRPVARGNPTHRPGGVGQWALGGPGFIASLAHTASRRVAPGQRGRPRKKPAAPATAGDTPEATPTPVTPVPGSSH